MEPSAHTSSLENRIALLEASLKEKSDFLSMITHQLRTPLTAQKWMLKMILDGDLGSMTPEQKNMIARGLESNEHMIRMLGDIANAHHVSEWKMRFDLVPIDIAQCIIHSIESFTAEASHKKITLRSEVPDSLPLVHADKERICLLIGNLIENAIKYNREQGTVTIHAEVFKNNLVVSVADTGFGIPLAEQKKIFSKFYRAENIKSSHPGTGLGLFIGKQIIEAHHGALWFESVENIGTTFFFSLPLAQG